MWEISSESRQSPGIQIPGEPSHHAKTDTCGPFPRKKRRPEQFKIKVHGKDGFLIGKQDVNLRYIEQLIDTEQTAALGLLLKYTIEKLADGTRTIDDIVKYLADQLKHKGLSFLSEGSYIPCGYAMPRIQEIYSCFNRYRR